MDRRERARHRIANQDRHAISSLNTSEHVLRRADDHIAVHSLTERVLRGLRILGTCDHAHVRSVNLPTTRQGPLARKKLEKATTILQNVLRRVVVKPGKTKRIRRHVADAAESRREAVDEAVFFEWRTNKRAHAAGLAPVKSSFGEIVATCDHFHRYRHYRSRSNSRSAPADAAFCRPCLHCSRARLLRLARRCGRTALCRAIRGKRSGLESIANGLARWDQLAGRGNLRTRERRA